MKKILFVLLFFIFAFPAAAFAHGGVEKRIDDTLVTLFQSPLSPLIGEQVQFTFVLQNAFTGQRLVHKTVRLEIIKTTTGDASQDTIVQKENVTSDVNGTVNFLYNFPDTHYYDIELQFGKTDNQLTSTGFLVQPRSTTSLTFVSTLCLFIISCTINVVLFIKLRKKTKKA